jgi:recombination protein RecT
MTAVAVQKPATSPAKVLSGMLDRTMPVIADVVADGYDAKRLLRMAVLSAEKNPDIYTCAPSSVIAAVVEAARLGLDVGGVTGEAYLIPVRNRAKGTTECQLRVGYKGLIRLAERGRVHHIQAEVVYSLDDFNFYRDEKGDHFKHIPCREQNRGEVTGCYAYALFDNGIVQFEWMPKVEIDTIRARSMAEGGPWSTDYAEMAKKTVIIRLSKDLPISVHAKRAAEIESRAEAGHSMQFDEASGETYTEQPA